MSKIRVFIEDGQLSVEKLDKSDFLEGENKIIEDALNRAANSILFHSLVDVPAKMEYLSNAVNSALGVNEDEDML